MTINKNPSLPEISIAGISETIIINYFITLNANNFISTSALFAENGIMYPPFESPLIGKQAIITYLQEEAQDIKTYPQQGTIEHLPNNYIQIQVTGKAETSWCGVNILWLFILNPQKEITEAKIQLLASPQELFSLRQPSKEYNL